MNDNLINKKAKYEELAKKITSKYRKDMKDIKGIIELIENNGEVNENDTLETIVFKKYLELENVKNVADYINSLGYRIKTQSYIGQRKYTSNDISEIIISDVDIEKKLKDTVKELHSQHSIAMAKRYY
ncbi:hypothetical protein DP144_13895 [Clostridium tetani]|uniref:hypothetical protein n=1 Tax=Clostridium tetani TaxID=1513 RepID=UPI00100ACEA8|nr:hypothetical protein [Clostridium tetani]RXM73639.1 hypothetical protein DP154_13900 [Clostridium tetani]RYU97821.1 hypothetical protein DP144_13895 [Clostridium tetani]